MPFTASYTNSYYGRYAEVSSDYHETITYDGDYEYSDGSQTVAGILVDGTSTGANPGDYYGAFEHNSSVSAHGTPIGNRPTLQDLTATGYIQRNSTQTHAIKFSGGSYGTSAASPNRVIVQHTQEGPPSYKTFGFRGYFTDEWTIEMYIWPKDDSSRSSSHHQVIFDARTNGTAGVEQPIILLRADGTIRVGHGTQGANVIHATHPIESSTGAMSFYDYTTSGEWQHLAVTKKAGSAANNINIFVNGAYVGGGIANSTVNEGIYEYTASSFHLADDYWGETSSGRQGFVGMIESIRLSKGNKYPAPFTSLPDLYNT